MSVIDTTYARVPFTDRAGDYELELTADDGVPAALTDPNVITIVDPDGANATDRAPRFLSLLFRTDDTADLTVGLAVYNRWSEQWYVMGKWTVTASPTVDTSNGAVIKMDGGTSHVAIMLSGLTGGKTLYTVATAEN
jgi:hypothetical protein